MPFSRISAVALAASLPFAIAQTFTSCNPTEKNNCGPDIGLNAGSYSADFTQGSGANASWSAAAYTTINYGSNGAEFTINEAGQAPTISSDFYIFFGKIDVTMKAAPGTGIVSSIVLESDDLDEIDWEFLGGNTAQVETNFFGKGNTTSYDRAVYYPVSTPQSEFHTYTVDWNSERIEFIIDGTIVRTLAYTDPLTVGGKNYPQTPMRLKLGNWAGGGPGEPQGTVEWAGGKCDFGDAPFTMYVKSVEITNYNPADKYEYSDETGSWQSIKLINGDSSSGAGGSNSSSAGTLTASASGATSTGGSPETGSRSGSGSAPTSSISVGNVKQTQAAVSSTVTGSSYSMNSASASALNNGTLKTSVVGATTEVPGSSPTGTGANVTAGSSATSTGPASATGTNAAVVNTALTSGSLLAILFGFFLL